MYQLLTLDDHVFLRDRPTKNIVYIKTYGTPEEGQKHPSELQVGQSTVCRFRLSGERASYRIVRLPDGAVNG